MNCPKCNHPDVEEDVVEVDIGVGIQRHLQGCVCPVCGPLAVHDCCGGWEFSGHCAWCNHAPGN